MRRALLALLVATTAGIASSCQLPLLYKFDVIDVAVTNRSDTDIWVDDVLADGTHMGLVIGVVSSGSQKTHADRRDPIPDEFLVEFKEQDRGASPSVSRLPTAELRAALEKALPARAMTLHFVYSREKKFVLKVELERGEGRGLEQELWPDQAEERYRLYQRLSRSVAAGDFAATRRLLEAGAPLYWADDPISGTPLDLAIGWGHSQVFRELLRFVPADYPLYMYLTCVRMATVRDHEGMLTELLAHPYSRHLPSDTVLDLFYRAGRVSTLRILFERFPLDVDVRLGRDGQTLLSIAVQRNDPELVRWLLDRGADLNARDSAGKRPIDLARTPAMSLLLWQRR